MSGTNISGIRRSKYFPCQYPVIQKLYKLMQQSTTSMPFNINLPHPWVVSLIVRNKTLHTQNHSNHPPPPPSFTKPGLEISQQMTVIKSNQNSAPTMGHAPIRNDHTTSKLLYQFSETEAHKRVLKNVQYPNDRIVSALNFQTIYITKSLTKSPNPS